MSRLVPFITSPAIIATGEYVNRKVMGPSIKCVRIELGQSTAEGTCWGPCGLNSHGSDRFPRHLGKMAWKLSWTCSINNGMTPWSLLISNLACVLLWMVPNCGW